MGRQDISPPVARGAAVIAVAVAAIGALWFVMADRGQTLAELPATTTLVCYALIVGAGASVYFHWRLSGDGVVSAEDRHLPGWLVVGLVVAGVHGFLGSFLHQASPEVAVLGVDSWLLASQVLMTVLLLVMARAARHVDLRHDPALVGVVGGLTLGAATCLAMVASPGFRFGPVTVALLVATLLLSCASLALTLLQLPGVPLWVRGRLVFSVVSLVGAQAASHATGPGFAAVAVIGNALGTVALCALAARLLRSTVAHHQEQVRHLHSELLKVEVAALGHRELLHEVGSTVAGIATASSVIKLRPELSGPPRDRLEQMMAAEVARLVRLMSDRAVIEPERDVVIDEVVEPLVVSHQARGLDVHWAGTGLLARGDSDDLAEVVNILLENAARHGGGRVELSVSEDDEMVEIRCSDHGDGVAPDVRGRLFESGARGVDSPGQGLGLAIAHRLMTQRGGTLELVEGMPGATFAARLPKIGTANAALDHAS
jgi:signal transduction histidine kinase